MNLWTISLFDPTPYDGVELRYAQIAREAIKLGHTVTHFTSSFRHTKKEHRFTKDTVLNVDDGYTVVYLHSKGYKKNISFERLFAHRDFANILLADLKKRNQPDAILISMPPLSSAKLISQWASENKLPVIVDIIDPWPDSFIKDVPAGLRGVSKAFIFPFVMNLKSILSNCDALISISDGYLEWALSYTDRQLKTSSFYPALDLQRVQQKLMKAKSSSIKEHDRLTLIYAGSLGSSYDLPTILEAAARCDKEYPGRTEFIIAGTGPQSSLVERKAADLNNLTYVGWVNEDELMKLYADADLGLIQHMDNLTQTVTYKLFSYLSAGLPVLNSLQSEMIEIISENNVGLNNMNGDVDTLVANIETFMSDPEMLSEYKKNALKLTKSKGDSATVYPELLHFIQQITEDVNAGTGDR